MATYGPESYGDAFADVYDEWYAQVSDVQACVRAISELAQGGRVLELGVGTGRIAIPLAATGADVVGVDASSAMLDRLSAHDPTGGVQQVQMDFGTALPEGPFDVVFVAYNTFFNLTSSAAQSRCLELVRSALAPTGHFAVEVFVPHEGGGHRGVDARLLDLGAVLNVTVRDPHTQTVRGQQVELRDGGYRLRPWQIHYLSPGQLDERARWAGLHRVARWGDWNGAPFDDTSDRHVSVYAPR